MTTRACVWGQFHHSSVVSSDRSTRPLQQASLATMAGKPGPPSCLRVLPFNHKSTDLWFHWGKSWCGFKNCMESIEKGWKSALFPLLMTKQADMTLEKKLPVSVRPWHVKAQLTFHMLVFPFHHFHLHPILLPRLSPNRTMEENAWHEVKTAT